MKNPLKNMGFIKHNVRWRILYKKRCSFQWGKHFGGIGNSICTHLYAYVSKKRRSNSSNL